MLTTAERLAAQRRLLRIRTLKRRLATSKERRLRLKYKGIAESPVASKCLQIMADPDRWNKFQQKVAGGWKAERDEAELLLCKASTLLASLTRKEGRTSVRIMRLSKRLGSGGLEYTGSGGR
jgi:hypothetical protein